MFRTISLPCGLAAVLMVSVVTSAGCRQVQTRTAAPAVAPPYESVPAAPTAVPGPPVDSQAIPPVPPSAAAVLGRDGNFGFTLPKMAEAETARIDSEPHTDDVQRIASVNEIDEAAETETALPLLAPLKLREPAAVELDRSQFLLELQADELLETPPLSPAAPMVSGLRIHPWTPPRPGHEPLPWPPEGLPNVSIRPGPTVPQWSNPAVPDAQPRRLAVENLDSDVRQIE